jgi:hypothetical protein
MSWWRVRTVSAWIWHGVLDRPIRDADALANLPLGVVILDGDLRMRTHVLEKWYSGTDGGMKCAAVPLPARVIANRKGRP